jgi:hypothetical protein
MTVYEAKKNWPRPNFPRYEDWSFNILLQSWARNEINRSTNHNKKAIPSTKWTEWPNKDLIR